MRRTTSRLRRTLAGPLLLLTTTLSLAGCAGRGNTEEANVLREPVSFPGASPFTPPMGTDQPDVTPPPGAGGTFPGDTVGLFGGTENEAACDKAQLVAFLQQDRAKAVAWAGVVGIAVDEIPSFVASLTPAVLRSDTRVINHGFKDGRATEIPAVFQAGTAVLVDVHGAPVTKCFCGNPLKPPRATASVTFTGPEWPHFSPTEVTVIAPVTQTVQQFVFVEPESGRAFQRPAGTAGRQDAPPTAPAPTTFASPASPPASATGTGTPGTAPPPGVVPTATPTVSPSAPASPTTTSPGGTSPGTSPATSPSPSPSPSPSVSPSISPPPGSPTVSPTPSPSITTTPSPSSSEIVRASWVVGDCFVRSGRAHGLVLVRSDSPAPHTFTVRVQLGDQSNPVAVETVRVKTAPGQVGQAEVDVPTATSDGRVQCAILSIVDENGVTPVAGDPLPPPPESAPMPAQPPPGQTTGPLPTPPTAPEPRPS